jgi:hypothetical protein
VSDRLRRAVEFARLPIRLAEHPQRLFGLAGKGLQTARRHPLAGARDARHGVQ